MLLTSCSLTVENVVSGVHDLGGLTIAAHVDRPACSLLANLGFIPSGLGPGGSGLAALELSAHTRATEFLSSHQELAHWPLVASGDAHRLNGMRAATRLTLREPSIRELGKAFKAEGGRWCEVLQNRRPW